MPQPKWKGQVVNDDIYGEKEDEKVKVWTEIYEYILSILTQRPYSLPVDINPKFQGQAKYNLTSSYVKTY